MSCVQTTKTRFTLCIKNGERWKEREREREREREKGGGG